MQGKAKVDNSGFTQFMTIIFFTLTASLLPEILFREWVGQVPTALPFYRLLLLIAAALLSHFLKHPKITKYFIVLGVLIFTEILTGTIFSTNLWQETFDKNSFVGNFGGGILLKIIGMIPVVGILLTLFKNPKEVYLTKGDLSIKAAPINWLGIKQDTISWKRLAVISAVLISFGTMLLTVFTVTGSSKTLNADALLKHAPLVILFALLNSFCEGIVYRSAILGSVKNVLPKSQAIVAAALIFGIGHYYGAPSGIAGVVMSFLLGWYLCRSMYETRGFVSSWIIHSMQDAVIFSTILLLGNY